VNYHGIQPMTFSYNGVKGSMQYSGQASGQLRVSGNNERGHPVEPARLTNRGPPAGQHRGCPAPAADDVAPESALSTNLFSM
jgi:hypothetical protein